MFDDDVLEVPAAERLQKRGGKGNIAQAVCSGPEKPSRTWSSGRLSRVLTQNQAGFYLEDPWTWTPGSHVGTVLLTRTTTQGSTVMLVQCGSLW